MSSRNLIRTVLVAGSLVSPLVYATNGMNLDGYGPIAHAMGGASMAYDNGTAGVINNPATLGLMEDDTARMDFALGDLMPRAESEGEDSSATHFLMPAFGYTRKTGDLAYGVGVMAQGGMGTKYDDSSAFGALTGVDFTSGPVSVSTVDKENKSEVGVMRVMFPLAGNVNPDLVVGGSIDYVRAGMDIRWLMDGAHFADMMPTSFNPAATQTFGAIASGTLLNAFGTAMGSGAFTTLNYGYFDFDTGSNFTQAAKGTGWAGNLGFTYQANPDLSIGGVYHAKTHLSDLETGDGDATASFAVEGGSYGSVTVPVTGKVIIKDFQWPATIALGLSYTGIERWQLVADYKRIKWADAMKSLNMVFEANGNPSNGGFANTSLELEYYQDWKDQNVIQLGAAYQYSEVLVLRFGANLASNPIPDDTVSPLFPAVMENHFTGGFGYLFDKQSSLDASISYAPDVTVTNNWSAAGGEDQKISLGATTWQIMYSHRFE